MSKTSLPSISPTARSSDRDGRARVLMDRCRADRHVHPGIESHAHRRLTTGDRTASTTRVARPSPRSGFSGAVNADIRATRAAPRARRRWRSPCHRRSATSVAVARACSRSPSPVSFPSSRPPETSSIVAGASREDPDLGCPGGVGIGPRREHRRRPEAAFSQIPSRARPDERLGLEVDDEDGRADLLEVAGLHDRGRGLVRRRSPAPDSKRPAARTSTLARSTARPDRIERPFEELAILDQPVAPPRTATQPSRGGCESGGLSIRVSARRYRWRSRIAAEIEQSSRSQGSGVDLNGRSPRLHLCSDDRLVLVAPAEQSGHPARLSADPART